MLIVCLCLITLHQVNPPPSSSFHDSEYSLNTALKHVRSISKIPHPIGSSELNNVKDYILNELKRHNLDPQLQSTSAATQFANYFRSAFVQNIYAEIPSESSDDLILITAHYDSSPHSPGASDNGAAVATLLEIARIVPQWTNLKNSIGLLFTDSEEFGLVGAAAFIKKHPAAQRVRLIINLEARGTSGPSSMFQITQNNSNLISHFAQASSFPRTQTIFNQLSKLIPNDTDFSILTLNSNRHGFNFAFPNDVHHYHTPLDNVENLNQDSLNHHLINAFELVKHFSKINLDELNSNSSHVFFDVLGLFTIHYPLFINCILFLIAILLWIVGFIFLSREFSFSKMTFVKHLFFSVFSFISLLLIIWSCSYLLTHQIPIPYLQAYNLNIQLTILSLSFFAFMIYLFFIQTPPENLINYFSFLSFILFCTFLILLVDPISSYFLLIPLIFGLLIYLIRYFKSYLKLIEIIFYSLISIFFAHLFYSSTILSAGSLHILPGFFSLLFFYFLSPLFHDSSIKWKSFLSFSTLVLGSTLLFYHLFFWNYNKSIPEPITINWASDQSESIWLGNKHSVKNNHLIKNFFNNHQKKRNLNFDPDKHLFISQAPKQDIPSPTIKVLTEKKEDNSRQITLEIMSNRAANCLMLWGKSLTIHAANENKPAHLIRFSKEIDLYALQSLRKLNEPPTPTGEFCGFGQSPIRVNISVPLGPTKIYLIDYAFDLIKLFPEITFFPENTIPTPKSGMSIMANSILL